MNDKIHTQLTALSAYLAARRDAILQNWRRAAAADPIQTTVSVLTRTQFNDHIPQLLDAFESKLRSRAGVSRETGHDEDVKHGLQRWQQGYRLEELMHEWGHLQNCLAEELEAFAAQSATACATLTLAHRELMGLISEGINESASQYARMQRAEAAGHVRDLQQALAKVSEIERHRAEMIRQAVHDLRTNVQSVTTAAEVLGEGDLADGERLEFAKLIHQGVDSVASMLGDLMELARLEAGQERRDVAPFDAAQVLGELCTTMRPMAKERSLSLVTSGPPRLPVDGDAGKLRRLIQNLLGNALKYTVQGSVTVSWGLEEKSWWVIVKDTGPGLMAGPSAPIAAGLKEATASAREADENAAAVTGDTVTVLPLAEGTTRSRPRAAVAQPGEGIGLSIVKRLCELLDASLELASSVDTGTTFRVVFPRRYQVAAPVAPV